MALKFNPATGQTEDDGTPGLLDQVASVVGTVSPALGTAMKLAPMALDEGEQPVAPAPTATPPATPPPAPAPAPASPPAPAAAPPTTGIPTPPATPTLAKESATHTTVSPTAANAAAMRGADKEVAAATDQGAKALELEAKNRLKQAEIDQAKQEIEATQKRQEAQRAQAAQVEAERRKKDIDAQATRDQDGYKAAAAAGDRGFWGNTDTVTKKQWALSIMFGSIAQLGGADENPGQRLLDKAMHDWTTERDKKLLRLQQVAEKSSGLQRTFWRDWGDEYKARKELQDAAAYLTVADQIDAMGVKMRALIPAQAAAANAAKAADYREQAAGKRQAVVDQRASRFAQTDTTVSTEQTGQTPAQIAQADKERQEGLFDLAGNYVGRARRPDEGEKLRAGQAATNALHDSLRRLQAFTAKEGTVVVPGFEVTADKERDTLVATATGHLTTMFQTGVLQDKEYQRYQKMLKPSIVQSTKGAQENLGSLIDLTGEAYNRRVGSQGIKAEHLPRTAAGADPAAGQGGGVRKTFKLKDGRTVTGTQLPNGDLQVD